MGFRQGGFCSVWSIDPGKFGNTTMVRMSSSRRNKKTGEHEQDFSGFCTFIGKAHEMAQNLHPQDRIRILECDVGTFYDKEKKKEHVNFKVFDFEMANGNRQEGTSQKTSDQPAAKKKTAFEVDGGEPEESNCPF